MLFVMYLLIELQILFIVKATWVTDQSKGNKPPQEGACVNISAELSIQNFK